MPASSRLLTAVCVAVCCSPVAAQDSVPPTEDDYYKLLRFEIPRTMNLEVGAIEVMPNGTLAVGTRRGDIYAVHNAWSDDPAGVQCSEFQAILSKDQIQLAFEKSV